MSTDLRDSLFLLVRDDQVILVLQSALALQSFQVWRTKTPVAPGLSRHDVKVKVRYFLPAANPVVLVQQHSVRRVGVDQCPRQAFGGSHDGRFFGFFEVEKGRRVAARNDNTLADFELPAIQQRHRQIVFLDDLPLMRIAVGNLAEEARVTLWHRKVHIDSQVSPGGPRKSSDRPAQWPSNYDAT